MGSPMSLISKKSKPKKVRVTSFSIRENKGKDLSPSWEGHENWSTEQYRKTYYDAMQYYNIQTDQKDLKQHVIKWMQLHEYGETIIRQFEKIKDWKCTSTMGWIAACLLKGMPATRVDFNGGKNTEIWLKDKIQDVLVNDSVDLNEMPEVTQKKQIEKHSNIITSCEEFEEAIDKWMTNPDKFDTKNYNTFVILKSKELKPQQVKHIKESYLPNITELQSIMDGTADDDLKEAHNIHSKKNIKSLLQFYNDIINSCDLVIEESKINRKPRAKKPIDKAKVISSLKYKKEDKDYKLNSINPIDIINAKELWCFDTKTRKLYKYIADDNIGPLNVKGSMIVGYDTTKSIGKTLLKPKDQLVQFNNAGKIALRTFMENIETIGIKASGKITETQVLLKVQA